MKQPVVVYAASGYTGRLTCLALTRYRVPFIAAGRSAERLEAVVQECRALGADCVAQTAEHTPGSLRSLFRDAKVVINISGPFSKLGRAVVDASLEEGCHYLDSTGEQDFMMAMRSDYGPAFLREKLVLSPSAAFLWTPAPALTEICLETPNIDSIQITFAPPELQTVASLQSMMRMFRRPVYRIVNRQHAVAPLGEVRQVVVPGTQEPRGALCSGGSETFFLGDPRVLNYEVLFVSDSLVKAARVKSRVQIAMAKVFGGDAVDRFTDRRVLKFMQDPPAEVPETSRYTVTATAASNTERVRAILRGVSPYVTTGIICADAARRLLRGDARKFGYTSLAHTFGARTVLSGLENEGAKLTVEVDKAAGSSVNDSVNDSKKSVSGLFNAQPA